MHKVVKMIDAVLTDLAGGPLEPPKDDHLQIAKCLVIKCSFGQME